MLRQQARENERLQADLTTQAEINAAVTQLARKNAVECASLKADAERQEAKVKAMVEALELVASAEKSALDLAYVKGVAKAVLANHAAAKE